ncbi:hydrolase [Anaerocolumna xylanovorans]|uniref:Nicotinamidase-related amidase n=1 Tax=Anaerocolumna xylanovorans DSM 12503 TaxID=1121345 RepID=A0A1M7YF37_9FIRM|nr:hydrolase [Anaerocolumna xylanovorans]SHO51196.1 Nicotinamidase-related amidase [Anaerocolumna xylanovorans DSM 12503]
MKIKAEDTMVLVIDVQEKLVPVMKNSTKCVRNIKLLTEGLSLLNIPFLITQQYTKGLGMTVPEIRGCLTPFSYYEKITFSCYENEEIRESIKNFQRKNIILCGIEAHICVLQTAVDLRAAGYQVIAVTDCMDSRKEEDREEALKRFAYEGIMTATYESLLFELTRSAGSDIFKAISRLIK